MSSAEPTTEAPIADETLLDDPLAVAEQLRSEAIGPRNLLDVEPPADALATAYEEDAAAFEGRTSHTIGQPGSAAWAQHIHETWRTKRQELAEAEREETDHIRLDPRLSDLGRSEALEALGKQHVEAREKQLGSVEQRVDEVLAGREAICRQLVVGQAPADDRSAELKALDSVAAGLRLQAFMTATTRLTERQFTDGKIPAEAVPMDANGKRQLRQPRTRYPRAA
jgi:hypothetical protein